MYGNVCTMPIKIIIRQQLHFLIMYTYIHLLTHLGRIHILGINIVIANPVLYKYVPIKTGINIHINPW